MLRFLSIRRERRRRGEHRILTDRSRDWDGSGCCKSVVPPSAKVNRFLRGEGGWDARVRTWEWRNQNPLPYHLATSHHAVWKTGARATAERHHNQSSQGRQWCVAMRHQPPVEGSPAEQTSRPWRGIWTWLANVIRCLRPSRQPAITPLSRAPHHLARRREKA